MEPQVTAASQSTSVAAGNKHFLAAFFLSFMWGVFGADRFYLGKWVTAVLKLITFGGFGIWAIVDLSLIMSGAMRDNHGHPLIDYQRYKGLAARIVIVFALCIGIATLLGGLMTIWAVQMIMDGLMQSNPFENQNLPSFPLPAINQV